MNVKRLAAGTLIVSLTLASPLANAQDLGSVVDRAAIEQALAQKTEADQAARDSIRNLLRRDDVKAMAASAGLDLRRAESAASTLGGEDLERAAQNARVANDLLAGGASGTIRISVVTLLLIIIIVILLAD